MYKDFWEDHSLKLVLFISYSVISTIYLVKLFKLNALITNYTFLEIITLDRSYDYLIGAIGLLALGVLYLFFLYNHRWEIGYYALSLPTLLLLAFLTIVIMCIIIYAIQNPILRAFMITFVIGSSALYAQNK